MRRRLLKIAVAVVAVVAVGLFVLHRATRHVPDFYREALEVDPVAQETASDEMLRRAAALASSVNKRKAHWEAVFTQAQINGWLAVDMVKNHPDALPPALSDPRVVIHPNEITVACRYERSVGSTVLSLTLEVYLPKPNQLSIRCRKARAGALPLPLGSVLDRISETARKLHWQVQWQQADGDPVALVTIPTSDDQRTVTLEALRLAEGRIEIAGSAREP